MCVYAAFLWKSAVTESWCCVVCESSISTQGFICAVLCSLFADGKDAMRRLKWCLYELNCHKIFGSSLSE